MFSITFILARVCSCNIACLSVIVQKTRYLLLIFDVNMLLAPLFVFIAFILLILHITSVDVAVR